MDFDTFTEKIPSRELWPEPFSDYCRVKEHLRLRLINYENNTGLLRDVPYIRWNDLAVIFCYETEEDSVMIQSLHLSLWKKKAETLYGDAMENMKNKMPGELFSLKDLLMGMAVPDVSKEPPMYVLTNRKGQYGAAAMLYSGKMRKLADAMDSDLIILPSSIHEVLLIADHEWMRPRWKAVVGEVNRSFVDPGEVLSDNIYHYSREKDAVELVPAG